MTEYLLHRVTYYDDFSVRVYKASSTMLNIQQHLEIDISMQFRKNTHSKGEGDLVNSYHFMLPQHSS